jgi:hypothetical protein
VLQRVQLIVSTDLHHGEDSDSPPWDTLEVYGATSTPAVREALAAFRVDMFTVTPRGFLCSRPRKVTA